MTIKNGFNDKPLKLSFSGQVGSTRLWVTQEGLPEEMPIARYRETLSYVSINELIELRDEIVEAIKVMAGV